MSIIPITNRAFRFGDGLFETLLVWDGVIKLWPRHLARLKAGLEYLSIPFPCASEFALKQQTEIFCRQQNLKNGYVRLIITRGDGGNTMGYSVPPKMTPTLHFQAVHTNPPINTLPAPIRLGLAETRLFYPYPCKTLNALPYIMAGLEAKAQGVDNVLMLCQAGLLAETSNANLFWIKGDTLFTPALSQPIVPGVMRDLILEIWEGRTEQGLYPMDVLKKADAVFLSNVGGLITPVGELSEAPIKFNNFNKTIDLYNKIINVLHHDT
jgi:4-amino-4-deoxychorismate lyase